MNRIYLILTLLFITIDHLYAQELVVKSFSFVQSDLTAQTHCRKDLNNKNCALVKVQFVGDIAEMQGNIILPLVKCTNETWVYMPQNSRHLKVFTKNFLPIMVTFVDYGIEKLESNKTYVLVLNRKGRIKSDKEKTDSLNLLSSLNGFTTVSDSSIKIPVKDGVYIEMVKVEAGVFMMGNEYFKISDTDTEDIPSHKVVLTNDYYIGKFEVTQNLWKVVMGTNPSEFKGDNLPVENISWFDCQEFISRLNKMTGRKFRLPTEAEWEYAARGGKKSKGYKYSGSDNWNDVAWNIENSDRKTHPVGIKQPNELALYDMSGNVAEWCQDWYGLYATDVQTNPYGRKRGMSRIVRGGFSALGVNPCRVTARDYSLPSGHGSGLGFRLVLSVI